MAPPTTRPPAPLQPARLGSPSARRRAWPNKQQVAIRDCNWRVISSGTQTGSGTFNPKNERNGEAERSDDDALNCTGPMFAGHRVRPPLRTMSYRLWFAFDRVYSSRDGRARKRNGIVIVARVATAPPNLGPLSRKRNAQMQSDE